MWKVILFVLSLGLDSFAISAALGTHRPTRGQRWRMSGVFVAFEAGMPLLGLALGAPAARPDRLEGRIHRRRRAGRRRHVDDLLR